MSRQWLTLMAILLVYIPVAIDATVLHVAAPTLSVALGTSGNELLWIIDIYSLVMAGMVLPMGAVFLARRRWRRRFPLPQRR
ncbi:methyl viologen resistance protein smvA [Klebsiella pneumoniae]|nr:methyl viologen resistance protein smvA [Klebsiella pneumoniae]